MKSFLNILKSRLEFFEEDIKSHINYGFDIIELYNVRNLIKGLNTTKKDKKEFDRIINRINYFQDKLLEIEFDWSKYE